MIDAAFDAVVLAGGAARRLGGADKPAQRVGPATLLDRVVDAVSGAATTVVVGPRRPTARPVLWCREEPPGGGPVAAIAAALPHVGSVRLMLLAADLPWIAPAVAPLLAALDGADTAVLVDGEGRRNVLAAAWHADPLRRAVASGAGPAGRSVRSLYDVATVRVVPDLGGWGADCDTWEDLEAAHRRAAGEGMPRTTG